MSQLEIKDREISEDLEKSQKIIGLIKKIQTAQTCGAFRIEELEDFAKTKLPEIDLENSDLIERLVEFFITNVKRKGRSDIYYVGGKDRWYDKADMRIMDGRGEILEFNVEAEPRPNAIILCGSDNLQEQRKFNKQLFEMLNPTERLAVTEGFVSFVFDRIKQWIQ